jgi:pimeloyl-ACP methyl ester carboxylesterase
VQIRYVAQGAGAPVVLLHGYTGTIDRHFVSNGVLANVAKDHRAIAMGYPRHGKSGKPHDPNAYGDELKAARFPMIEIVATLDPSIAELEPFRRAHPPGQELVLADVIPAFAVRIDADNRGDLHVDAVDRRR